MIILLAPLMNAILNTAVILLKLTVMTVTLVLKTHVTPKLDAVILQ
jgi:hypothetical protein